MTATHSHYTCSDACVQYGSIDGVVIINLLLFLLKSTNSTLDPIYLSWFNQYKSIPNKTMMETSKPVILLAANPGECEPGQWNGLKILPECNLKQTAKRFPVGAPGYDTPLSRARLSAVDHP